MITNPPRPCERRCVECNEFKHHSRYRTFERKDRPRLGETVLFHQRGFSPICRDCEQKKRNEKKNADRPLAIIQQRARAAATKADTSFNFFWTEMNYRSLVPMLRAALSSEGLCQGCGHGFDHERDIQIDHWEAPRSLTDWGLLHARNLRLICGSCNRTKGKKPPLIWLDEQEGARLSNKTKTNPEPQMVSEIAEKQLELFKFG